MTPLIASTSTATSSSVAAPALRQIVTSISVSNRCYATAASASAAPAGIRSPYGSSSSHVQSLPSTPKPPTKSWYSGRPALTEFITTLQNTVRNSRQELFRRGYLGSVDQDVRKPATSTQASTSALTLTDASLAKSEAPISSVRWLSQQDMAGRLQVTQVRLAHYRRITSLLSELQSLAPLLSRSADFLKSSAAFGANGQALYGLDTQRQAVESLINGFARTNTLAVMRNGESGESAVAESRNRGRGVFDAIRGVGYGVGRKKSSSARAWIVPIPVASGAASQTSTSANPAPDTKESESTKTSAPSQRVLAKRKRIPYAGRILVNAIPVERKFPDVAIQTQIRLPFTLTETMGKYNVFILARGGGTVAQAQAASSACARALAAMDETGVRKAILSKADLLRRDPRVVERKKTGMPKARKRYTWVKR